MSERRSRPLIQYLYSHKLSTLTGIPQGRWMMGSNHPKLGGGFVFSLGHLSNKETCTLINNTGIHLWQTSNTCPKGEWIKVKPEKVVKWSILTLEKTKSKLYKPTDSELIEVMFNH